MRNLQVPEIDSLEGAYAFLLGLIFNQNIKAERAWQAPFTLFERLSTNDPNSILYIPVTEVEFAIQTSPAIHPFSRDMASRVISSTDLLISKYGGDARNIWKPEVGAQELISRFVEFYGIGNHKAIVGLFLLTVEKGVIVWDDGTQISIAKECSSLANLYAPFDSIKLTPKSI
jgi:uncharacterized HhH-GPD family protein